MSGTLEFLTDQRTGATQRTRRFKRRRGFSGVRVICIVCQSTPIHANDHRVETKVCRFCESLPSTWIAKVGLAHKITEGKPIQRFVTSLFKTLNAKRELSPKQKRALIKIIRFNPPSPASSQQGVVQKENQPCPRTEREAQSALQPARSTILRKNAERRTAGNVRNFEPRSGAEAIRGLDSRIAVWRKEANR